MKGPIFRVLFLSVWPMIAVADLRLPSIISDHALLQAGKSVAIWGWAQAGAQVKVAFVGSGGDALETFAATADARGKWSGQLPSMKAGTAGQLQITSDKDGSKTVQDILVGEVWLGGGQSNMAYDIGGEKGGDWKNPDEVAQIGQNVIIAQKEADAAKPPIRYFEVKYHGADDPLDDVMGAWVIVDSTNVSSCSATAWNFAIALQDKLQVPIGLILSSVGGTPVETWMSKETLEKISVSAAIFERSDKARADLTAKYEASLKAWADANPTPEAQLANQATKPPKLWSTADGHTPNRFYNAMIHGLEPYTIRGIIWYQADGNVNHPLEYGELFQALIKEWREDWKEPTLPFYFVEMNNMWREKDASKPVQPSPLCLIREQQHEGLLQPDVGMVCAIDVGIRNPHFPNKKPVGERLAGLASHDCYGQPGQVNGPMYKGFTVEGNKVRLTFTDAEGLRVHGGGDLKGFAIRGATGEWVWATGKIDGQDVLVWNDAVPSPAAVRYAWAPNPIVSVENGAGLPLYPFRTDTDSKE